MHPALLYLPGDRLTLPELAAARIDGHVVEVGDGYMPADTVEGADARASSIAARVPDRMGVCGPTAAWVHGAGVSAPAPHHVRRIGGGRFRASAPTVVVVHEPGLTAGDLTMIGGLAVATPVYVGMELALGAQTHPGHEGWLQALLSVMPELGPELHHRLDALHRRPGRTYARRVLTRLAGAQEVVTR